MESAARLLIDVEGVRHTVDPSDGEAVIGRDSAARIQVDDTRISRAHLRLITAGNVWQATDAASRNGVYLDGQRVTSVVIDRPITLALGDPHGVRVQLQPATTTAAVPAHEVEPDDQTTHLDSSRATVDPGMLRTGQYVAARRQELGISQRDVGAMKVLSPAALVTFEKGRSWPRDDTLAKLEDLLRCPRGTLAQIRYNTTASSPSIPVLQAAAVPKDTATALSIRALESSLRLLTAAGEALPAPEDPDFSARASATLNELRELQAVATELSRAGAGQALVRILGHLRRIYSDIMLRAAQSPNATLGQRLFATRRTLDLSIEDLAAIADVPTTAVLAAENEQPLSSAHADALAQFVTHSGA